MKKSTLIFISLIISCFVYCQTENTKGVMIHDISAFSGMQGSPTYTGTLTDFIKLAPNSAMLNNDFTGFLFSDNYNGPPNSNTAFNINMGFLFYNCEKKEFKANPKLNVGLAYNKSNYLSFYSSKEEIYRFDTLSSASSSYEVYMDTVVNASYEMSYYFEQLGINSSLIFATNPESRWSIYAGVGVTAAVSLKSNTDISYYSSSAIVSTIPASNYSSARTVRNSIKSDYSNEFTPTKTNVSFFGYIPLGLDFRIGKKKEFWKKMHLAIELQPGIVVDCIPELGNKTYGMLKSGFGLRVDI
jgi:hypothetical protein